MGKPTEAVVLDRQWDVGSLLGATFKLFWKHKLLFATITALVAVPYVVLIDVLWGRQLADEDVEAGWAAFVVPTILGATIVPALITALHVVSLLRIADGEEPSVAEAYALALQRVVPVIGAIVLYGLAVAIGLVLLIVPGIWLSIRLYFGAQAVVVDGLGPVDALKRSAELVKDRWWQTLGRLLLAGIVFALITIPLSIPLGFVDYGVGYVVLDAVLQTIVLSLTALFGTLVFMDYHGHRQAPDAAPAAYGGFDPPQAPPRTFG